MARVWVEGLDSALLIEENGRVDLSYLELQPHSILIGGLAGCVDSTGITRRTWQVLTERFLHDATLGTKDNPVVITGTPVVPASTPLTLQRAGTLVCSACAQ